jgi:hypothetical protein
MIILDDDQGAFRFGYESCVNRLPRLNGPFDVIARNP